MSYAEKLKRLSIGTEVIITWPFGPPERATIADFKWSDHLRALEVVLKCSDGGTVELPVTSFKD